MVITTNCWETYYCRFAFWSTNGPEAIYIFLLPKFYPLHLVWDLVIQVFLFSLSVDFWVHSIRLSGSYIKGCLVFLFVLNWAHSVPQISQHETIFKVESSLHIRMDVRLSSNYDRLPTCSSSIIRCSFDGISNEKSSTLYSGPAFFL